MKRVREKLSAVLDLIRWSKPYGTLLLLAPTLWSLVIASKGTPPVQLMVIFALGAFLMRSAGCAINDIADQHLDVRVERTKNRPLPSGRLTVYQAFAVFLGLSIMAFGLIWWLNLLTRLLSIVAIFLAMLYPLTKRFFNIPQLFMGIAFGWGVIMAWAAVRNTLETPVIFIFLATLCWATAYDTIYAMMDREEDVRLKVKSSPLIFGRRTWLAIGTLFGLSVFFMVFLGVVAELGAVYYPTVAIVAFCFLYQTVLLKQDLDRPMLFSLFKSHVGVGFIVLIGIFLGYYYP